MGLAVTLNNALSGLNVNQQALTVLSQNIANANTAGYSRQNLNLKPVYLEGLGAGVTIEDVTRKVDQYLQATVTKQTSVTGQTGVLNDYASRIQILLGNPGSNNDITSYVTGFFNAVRSLATSPQDATQQSSLLNAANALSSQMNQLASGLQNLRLQADQDIGTAVSAINQDLKNLHDLNAAISNATSLGQSTAGLEDSFDMALNDLAQYMNIQTTAGSRGQTNVYASGGTALVDENLHQLSYNAAGALQSFINDSALSPLNVSTENTKGETIGTVALVSGGQSSTIANTIITGKLAGLIQMRDQDLPGMLSQLDQLAAGIRDQVNIINNSGSGFPGSSGFTGTRAVRGPDISLWSGSVRIALLDSSGQPVASPYNDGGFVPLTLDLSSMNTGSGTGNPSVQGIINAINQYYRPQNKVTLGNLDNIQLVSDSTSTPGATTQFNFDFNLSNTSSTTANFFITGMSVVDEHNNPVSTPTINPSNIGVASFDTVPSQRTVTVNVTGSTAGLVEGQKIYLSNPGTIVDGIAASDLTGAFTITNITATSFQIEAAHQALTGGNTVVGVATNATPPTATVAAGSTARTNTTSILTADLSTVPLAAYYTISANVLVSDGQGSTKSSTITYRVFNNQGNLLNNPYGAVTASDDGTVIPPSSSAPLITASLVDANGNPLGLTGGQYNGVDQGYLKIQAANSNYIVAIDSLDSTEKGQPSNNPPVPGTNLGFSSYFGFNDFFVGSASTSNAGSALNLRVDSRIASDPSLISTGRLTPTSNNPNLYERNIGDNSVIQRLVALDSTALTFAAAGGLSQSTISLSGYAGQVIGTASTKASTVESQNANAQQLLTGYQQQSSSVSGVNLNIELANTIIYQNAYSASARVITVTNSLFTTLLQTFQ